ncbi:MAG: sensor histidine kinase [Terracidiphilus sp.]
MKPSPWQNRRILFGALFCLLMALSFAVLRGYMQSPNRGLPYRDSFAKGKADEWKALGGTWELVDGIMRNESDERGAKLLTGSPYWHNYSIEADVQLLGISGDAGLVIRSSDEEEGVNDYNGYYAGVRTLDNRLVLGRAAHGWQEANKQGPPGEAIRPFQWYHLKLLVYDCNIAATVTTSSNGNPISLALSDPDCADSGRVGLRSYSSGGMWRNVVVRPATHDDLIAMLGKTGSQNSSSSASSAVLNAGSVAPQDLTENQKESVSISSNTQSISRLRLASSAKPSTVTVRGAVVLTAPILFVQDTTGGAYIPQPNSPLLKVGDEVEVTGEAYPGNFSTTIEHATVKVLWAQTPMPPLSVTASQASTGKFDAEFVEVQGHLTGKERGSDNSLILNLDEGPQSFRAILNPGRSDYLLSTLKLGSSLRLRGICVVDPAFTRNLTPFVVLLRSNEDLQVLAGPPWWSTGHIFAIVFGLLLLALVVNFVYHRIENWRLQGVLEERQRLAHEMHDTLAQSFAGIGFQLQAIRNRLPEEEFAVLQQLDLASDLVRHSHEEARRSIATLRPESLESEDILTALDHCARRMVEGGTVRVVVEREGDQRPIPLRIADTLYRIGQEAIANAVRHAEPGMLTIRMTYGNSMACLLVEDNGTGFQKDNGLGGFGIRGMRRRAQSISAEFQIDSELGAGTRVRINAPLPPRITLVTWPGLLWRFLKEQWTDVRPSKQSNSNSYRG